MQHIELQSANLPGLQVFFTKSAILLKYQLRRNWFRREFCKKLKLKVRIRKVTNVFLPNSVKDLRNHFFQ